MTETRRVNLTHFLSPRGQRKPAFPHFPAPCWSPGAGAGEGLGEKPLPDLAPRKPHTSPSDRASPSPQTSGPCVSEVAAASRDGAAGVPDRCWESCPASQAPGSVRSKLGLWRQPDPEHPHRVALPAAPEPCPGSRRGTPGCQAFRREGRVWDCPGHSSGRGALTGGGPPSPRFRLPFPPPPGGTDRKMGVREGHSQKPRHDTNDKLYLYSKEVSIVNTSSKPATGPWD